MIHSSHHVNKALLIFLVFLYCGLLISATSCPTTVGCPVGKPVGHLWLPTRISGRLGRVDDC